MTKANTVLTGMVAVLMVLSGCAKHGRNALACRVTPADAELAITARSACGGSVTALMALAEAYERGDKIAKNESLAMDLYKSISFATTMPKTTYIYVPPAGKVAGYTMPIQTGTQTVQGHAEAQYRLAMMLGEGRGQQRDIDMALYYLRMAAAQGHTEAANHLNNSIAFLPVSDLPG